MAIKKYRANMQSGNQTEIVFSVHCVAMYTGSRFYLTPFLKTIFN